jgi:hypothetical protein
VRFPAPTIFLRDFENRHGLSLRTSHQGRDLDLDQKYIDSFLSGLSSFSDDYPPEIVLNMDKACWTVFEAPGKNR